MNNKNPGKMSRKKFESLFAGTFETVRTPSGKSYRKNGDIITAVRDGDKYITIGKNQARAKSWAALAKEVFGE